jgi:hypothetical protein
MLTARVDPALSVNVLGWRDLRYSDPARLGDDRPRHVRAASGLAISGGRLAVVQDDVAFIAMVAGEDVSAIVLPRGAGGRRRFEVALGNKQDKLDLESCIALGDDLYAFGSGSSPMRERIVHLGYATRVIDAAPLYRALREEVGSDVNIEGVAAVRKELWLFHRGNTGPDDPGATIVQFPREPLLAWLGAAGPLPEPSGSLRFDLGSVRRTSGEGSVRFGFTDAVGVGDRAFYIAAAEDSPNAIDDGAWLGSQLGVIEQGADGERVARAAPLSVEGHALKAEGLTFDPQDPRRVWVAVDPDDTETPSRLYQIELVGPW